MLGNVGPVIAEQYARNAAVAVELEARFGEYRDGRFLPGVPLSSFQRIEELFSTYAKPVITHSSDYIQDNIRKTVITPSDPDSSETVFWMRKTRIWNHDVPDYNIRLSMAREEIISEVTPFHPAVTRIKHRRSYIVFNGAVRIDLTTVDDRNEVEVELLDPKELDKFQNALRITTLQLLNSHELYTTREAFNLINYVNGILGGKNRYNLDHNVMVQARDLNLRDMVWGGLLGNKETSYTVTHKADGERRLLVFHESGIWLVFAPHHLNKVSTKNIPALHGTIIDGEEISLKHRREGAPTTKYWFLAFDCLARIKDRGIQEEPHVKRMQFAQFVSDQIARWQNPIFSMNTKDFRGFRTPEEFYRIMNEMFVQQATLPYQQDGFMFTPADTKYNPKSDEQPLFKRILTKYPDICKWKPKEKLSIDFLLKWGHLTPEGHRTVQLYSGNIPGQKESLVRFQGTRYNPFDTALVDTENPLTLNVANNTIVEYAWDYARGLLVPIRIRYEKTRPNRIDRVENIWDLIHNPIEEATMRGDDFTLVFAYHNRIKKALFNYATPTGGLTLLDIGSGRGGDVAKWKKFRRIVAVEPNGDHIVELQRRLELQGMQDRVRIVQAGGQDTEIITAAVNEFLGGPADVVAMMLSLSFFWQNRDIFTALVTTIRNNMKPQGKFVFMTIDGDAVEQVFDPMFGGLQMSQLKLGPALLNYNPPQLTINLPGTIVGEQQEWLVRLGDFLLQNFDFLELHRADGEEFLNMQENIYTKMYAFGAMKAKNPSMPALPGPQSSSAVTIPRPVSPISIPTIPRPVSPIMTPVSSAPKLTTIPTAIPALNVRLPSPPRMLPVAASPRALPTPQLPASIIPSRVASPPKIPLPPLAPTSSIPPLASLPPLSKRVPQTVTTIRVSKPLRAGDPGIGDDTYRPMTVPWYQNVVRIAAIGDGSCFFHALLKAYLTIYQDNASYDFRTNFVAKFRRDLAYLLQLPTGATEASPEVEGLRKELATLSRKPLEAPTYYETTANGAFLEFFLQQLKGAPIRDEQGTIIDFSLAGMQKLFNSNQDVGSEVYQYVAEITGVDIYVAIGYTDNLKPFISTARKGGLVRPAVIIVGNKHHYEVVGIMKPEGIQTVFFADDPFLEAYMQQKA